MPSPVGRHPGLAQDAETLEVGDLVGGIAQPGCHSGAIGAHRAVPEARPLSAGALRRVLRAGSGGLDVSYQVITGILRRA